jgi:hypothetical protein
VITLLAGAVAVFSCGGGAPSFAGEAADAARAYTRWTSVSIAAALVAAVSGGLARVGAPPGGHCPVVWGGGLAGGGDAGGGAAGGSAAGGLGLDRGEYQYGGGGGGVIDSGGGGGDVGDGGVGGDGTHGFTSQPSLTAALLAALQADGVLWFAVPLAAVGAAQVEVSCDP